MACRSTTLCLQKQVRIFMPHFSTTSNCISKRLYCGDVTERCYNNLMQSRSGCSVSVVVGRRTRDREIASSVPGRCIAG